MDRLGRLKKTPSVILSQTFDDNGNRHTLSANIGGSVDETFGALGNPIWTLNNGTSDFSNTYTYDHIGRMTGIAQANQSAGSSHNAVTGKQVSFGYDEEDKGDRRIY